MGELTDEIAVPDAIAGDGVAAGIGQVLTGGAAVGHGGPHLPRAVPAGDFGWAMATASVFLLPIVQFLAGLVDRASAKFTSDVLTVFLPTDSHVVDVLPFSRRGLCDEVRLPGCQRALH